MGHKVTMMEDHQHSCDENGSELICYSTNLLKVKSCKKAALVLNIFNAVNFPTFPPHKLKNNKKATVANTCTKNIRHVYRVSTGHPQVSLIVLRSAAVCGVAN